MTECFYIGRHEPGFNKHAAYILGNNRLLGVIPRNIDQEGLDEDSVSVNVVKKTLFVFAAYHNTSLVGLICIDRIDWENRNCRLQAGFFEDFSDLISDKLIQNAIRLVLKFCESQLCLKRVWSVMAEKGFGFEAAKSIFSIEGKTQLSKLFYLGCVLDN